MGNHAATGHALNMCGCHDVVGFESSAKAVINWHGIEPWDARGLIKENLTKQGELARRSPLRKVAVKEGIAYMKDKTKGGGGFLTSSELSREQFVETVVMLLGHESVPHTPQEREDLYAAFDSMDFDKNGKLCVSEWAAGLAVFFKGSTDDACRAVFSCLDTNSNGSVSKKELQAYLSPFVKAMSPSSAAALRPLLEKKATDDIYWDMDMDHTQDISSDEMLQWTKKGNNIVDKLADIIDKEVYSIWLAENKKRPQKTANGLNFQSGPGNGANQYGPPGMQYGPGPGPNGQYGPPGMQYGSGPGPNGQYGPTLMQYGAGNGKYGPPGMQYGPGSNSQYGPPGTQFGPGQMGPPGSGYGPAPGQSQYGGDDSPYGPPPGSTPTASLNDSLGSWLGSYFGGTSGTSGPDRPVPAANPRAAPAPPMQAPDPFGDDAWSSVPPPPPAPGRGAAPPSGGGYCAGGMPPPPAYNQAPTVYESAPTSYGSGSYGSPSSSPCYQSSAPYRS